MHSERLETIIALKERLHVLKTEMDLTHRAWLTAVRERDFDRQSSLIAQERDLIHDAAAVIAAFQHLIAQATTRTNALGRLQSPPV